MRQTKFGEQPGKFMLRSRGISVAQAALDIRVKQAHLQSTLDGNICPSVDVRERLPQLLDVTLDKLFTKTVLEWVDRRQQVVLKRCGCVCEVHSSERKDIEPDK
jgi:hypothetical protein